MGKNNANKIMHFKKKIMQYYNKSLIKNYNEILKYFNKNNDIALVMHQRALLQMPGVNVALMMSLAS